MELLSFASPRQQPAIQDAWQVRPWGEPAAPPPPEFAFQGESVSDWGVTPPVPEAQLPRLHVPKASIGGASELGGSVTSTPFLTPNFRALLGPGTPAATGCLQSSETGLSQRLWVS